MSGRFVEYRRRLFAQQIFEAFFGALDGVFYAFPGSGTATRDVFHCVFSRLGYVLGRILNTLGQSLDPCC